MFPLPIVPLVRSAALLQLLAVSALAFGPEAPFPNVRAVLEEYCLRCHGEDRQKGDVSFEPFTAPATLYRDLRLWDRVIEQLSSRQMPPADKPQPSEDTREALIRWLEHFRENLDYTNIPRHPGRPTLRRLNREEFSRTLRDLLRIDYHAGGDLPLEGSGGGGFDNNGDTLFLPPLLMEKFVSAVHAAVDRAFRDLRHSRGLAPHEPSPALTAEEAIRRNLGEFLPRAFRRPTGQEETTPYLDLALRELKAGADFDAAMAATYRAALLSPSFLFRIEQDRPGEASWPVNAHERAVRLSYFLWASMPDEELRTAADNGSLLDDAAYTAQILRMLDDPRAESLPRAFMVQWLGLGELETTKHPDLVRFPEFTPALRDAMMEEPVRFFGHLLMENRSLLDLIDSDYAFVNHRLAAHYGIPPAKTDGHGQEEVQYVRLPDRRRGGLLGMGAVHVVTSYPLRTSPVLRGKWILETLTGARIPPPPPGTGALPADEKEMKDQSLRDRLLEHQARPECFGCHSRMDPPGFALENFDAIGRWRDQVQGAPVDASGEMADGRSFKDVGEFKAILLQKRDAVMRQVVEKMLAYALGRGLEYTDQPVVHEICARLRAQGWPARQLVLEVARSYPFVNRGNP